MKKLYNFCSMSKSYKTFEGYQTRVGTQKNKNKAQKKFFCASTTKKSPLIMGFHTFLYFRYPEVYYLGSPQAVAITPLSSILDNPKSTTWGSTLSSILDNPKSTTWGSTSSRHYSTFLHFRQPEVTDHDLAVRFRAKKICQLILKFGDLKYKQDI